MCPKNSLDALIKYKRGDELKKTILQAREFLQIEQPCNITSPKPVETSQFFNMSILGWVIKSEQIGREKGMEKLHTSLV